MTNKLAQQLPGFYENQHGLTVKLATPFRPDKEVGLEISYKILYCYSVMLNPILVITYT